MNSNYTLFVYATSKHVNFVTAATSWYLGQCTGEILQRRLSVPSRGYRAQKCFTTGPSHIRYNHVSYTQFRTFASHVVAKGCRIILSFAPTKARASKLG